MGSGGTWAYPVLRGTGHKVDRQPCTSSDMRFSSGLTFPLFAYDIFLAMLLSPRLASRALTHALNLAAFTLKYAPQRAGNLRPLFPVSDPRR